MTKTIEMNQEAIHRIELVDKQGQPVDTRDYDDVEEFASDLNDELRYGVSLRVTYTNDDGEVVSKKLMNDYDCLPKTAMGRINGSFAKTFEKSLEALSKVYNITDEPVEVRL